MTECPDAGSEAHQSEALYLEAPPPFDRLFGVVVAQRSSEYQLAHGLEYFCIHQVWCGKSIGAQVTTGIAFVQQCKYRRRGVNDDQRSRRPSSNAANTSSASIPRSGRSPRRTGFRTRRVDAANSRTAIDETESPSFAASSFRRSTTSSGTFRKYRVLMSHNASIMRHICKPRSTVVNGGRWSVASGGRPSQGALGRCRGARLPRQPPSTSRLAPRLRPGFAWGCPRSWCGSGFRLRRAPGAWGLRAGGRRSTRRRRRTSSGS